MAFSKIVNIKPYFNYGFVLVEHVEDDTITLINSNTNEIVFSNAN